MRDRVGEIGDQIVDNVRVRRRDHHVQTGRINVAIHMPAAVVQHVLQADDNGL